MDQNENKSIHFYDLYPIKTEPTNDEERYIIEEAKAYVEETAISSIWVPNQHVDNVIALGKKNTDFLMKLVKENNHPQGMYSHFLIDVMFGLYKDDIKVEGYLGVDGCMKCLITLYDAGLLQIKPAPIESITVETTIYKDGTVEGGKVKNVKYHNIKR